MKKLSKLLFLILTPITPLTLISCNKNKTPNIDEKKDDTNRKLKLIKDLIFIHRNLEYEDEHEKIKYRNWIADLLINHEPQKTENNEKITLYMIQNKINLVINNIIDKDKINDEQEQQINELENTTKIIIELINKQNERINQLKLKKEQDDLSQEQSDNYEWLLREYKKLKQK